MTTIAQQIGRMNRVLLTQTGHARYSDAIRVVARCNISSNDVDLSTQVKQLIRGVIHLIRGNEWKADVAELAILIKQSPPRYPIGSPRIYFENDG